MLIRKSKSYYGTSRLYRRGTKQTSFVDSVEVSLPPLTERARNAHDPSIGRRSGSRL